MFDQFRFPPFVEHDFSEHAGKCPVTDAIMFQRVLDRNQRSLSLGQQQVPTIAGGGVVTVGVVHPSPRPERVKGEWVVATQRDRLVIWSHEVGEVARRQVIMRRKRRRMEGVISHHFRTADEPGISAFSSWIEVPPLPEDLDRYARQDR